MATLEYTALAVLVSLVLAVGGVAVDARAIPAAVGVQLRKAMCLVAGGDCFARGGARPCVVASESDRAEHRLALGVVRLRDGRTVLLERLSDGTFRVSLTEWTGGGAGMQLGVEAHLFGRRVGVDADGEAGLDLLSGRTFLARDLAAAHRLVEKLEGTSVGGGVAGVVRFLRGEDGGDELERTAAVRSRAEAQAVLEAMGLGPRAALLRSMTGAVRADRRTGDRGLGLRLDGEARALFGAALVQGSGGAVGSAGVELVLDRAGRMRELVVHGTGGVHGAGKLPSGAVAGGTLREVRARLDLTDPLTRELTDRLLGGDRGAARQLAAHVASGARIDVRHYATRRDDDTFGGGAGGFGASRVTTNETARLVAAEGREPGLGWSRRLDCLGVSA